MAVPKSVENERTLGLQAKLSGLSFDDMLGWPGITVEDSVLISGIIGDFSYVDLILRRMIEVLDQFDRADLPAKLQGRTGIAKMWEVENALQATKWMAGRRAAAFDDIRELRKIRNLVAHFVIRRFPDDDAFLFITKSEQDFERVFGHKPSAGRVMTGVGDGPQLAKRAKRIHLVLGWLATVAPELENFLMNDRSAQDKDDGAHLDG